MSGAWIPIWILGAPLVGLIVLSVVFKGGTSASTSAERDPRPLERMAAVGR